MKSPTIKKKPLKSKAKAGKPKAIVGGFKRKLPSLPKLAYISVVGVLLLSVIGYTGITYFEYKAYKKNVASAHWSQVYYDRDIRFQLCKVQRKSAYGIVHDVRFYTVKGVRGYLKVRLTNWRPQVYGNVWNGEVSSADWWADSGNMSSIALHFLSGDYVTYEVWTFNGPYTNQHTFRIGDMPFC